MSDTWLILVTHGELGATLLDQAQLLMGDRPLPTAVVGVRPEDTPEAIIERIEQSVNGSTGSILILTDLYGATPSNSARRAAHRLACPVVHGLNLPMLLRAYNYPLRSTRELAILLVEGGQKAIFSGDLPP